MAYANVIIEELEKVCNEGCDYIQFDEPVWTENVNEANWGADVLNYIIEKFPGVKFNLHICGGNAHRKRGYFGRYTDMIPAFKKLKIDEIHLEHCSLHYTMTDIFEDWDFKGSLSAGVVDQRIDNTENVEDVEKYTQPLLKYFKPEKILLTSECGFGHVPIEITRNKLKKLVEAAEILRKKY
jgi:5-methyltetrahydropteroyltriglutamate--homocysteine methyltransferase